MLSTERRPLTTNREEHVTVCPFKANINNLTPPPRLMFWSTNDELYNVDELIKIKSKTMNSAITRERPVEDMALLDAAFRHV